MELNKARIPGVYLRLTKGVEEHDSIRRKGISHPRLLHPSSACLISPIIAFAASRGRLEAVIGRPTTI